MQSVDVKALVQQAVGGEWEAFSARHPALSRAVDQRLFVELYTRNLRAEPEFLEAMKQVEMEGLAHSVMQELTVRVVTGWLRAI